ncbi:hypothetical protein [Streptomyces mirabilis]|uniref:hypothetical protein n=1 Tax=Streptomyces mirabilis TaxID=68239 RepID=UPI0033BC72FB
MTLPSVYEVRQWRVTWVGFDALLMVAMAATALLGWLRHRTVTVSATTTAVLLICDAWFDVSLAFGTSGVWLSAVLAACVELPLGGGDDMIRQAPDACPVRGLSSTR